MRPWTGSAHGRLARRPIAERNVAHFPSAMARRGARYQYRVPTAPAPRVAPWTTPFHVATILAACLMAFATSVGVPFLGDDVSAIVENPHLRFPWSWTHPMATTPASPVAGRPLVGFSLALNFAAGGLDPWGYHVVNILIHTAAALVLYGLSRRALATWNRASEDAALPTAFIACVVALIWAVHPLQTEVIAYTTQRTESLMGLFYLLTLYCAARSTERDASAGWSVGAVSSCALGMLCKESMVTAPLVALMYDAAFVTGGISEAWRQRPRLYLGLAATWLVAAALVWRAPRAASAGFAAGVDAGTYLLNQAVVIVHYARLAVWPVGLVHDYGPTTPIAAAAAWPFVVALLGLALATVAAWRSSPAVGFLGAWFFVTLAPASSVVPIATEVGAERRMYLPLVAPVVIAVVGAAVRIARQKLAVKPTLLAAAAVLVPALVVADVQRIGEYRQPERLWRTVLDRRPHGRAHLQLGMTLRALGRRDEALEQFRAGMADDPQAAYAAGVMLGEMKRLPESAAALRDYIGRAPMDVNVPRAHAQLARIAMDARDLSAAKREVDAALAMWPNDLEFVGLRGEVLLQSGDAESAARAFERRLAGGATDAATYLNLGLAQLNLDKSDAALRTFRTGTQTLPDSIALHNVLALTLAEAGRITEARQEFDRSLALDPGNPQTRADLDTFNRIYGRRSDTGRTDVR